MIQHLSVPPQIRLRTYLAAWYALFIVYGSLSPFTEWKNQGLSFFDVLTAPLSQTYSGVDVVINLLAYIPFGLLLGLVLRIRLNAGWTLLLTTLAGFAFSASMEFLQMYLPSRVSSNLDLLTNSVSTLAGALMAISIAPHVWFVLHLVRWRTGMFYTHPSRDFGLALMALWIFAQINPSLPMLGNVFISEVARPLFVAPAIEPFNWLECLVVALNLLLLGMLMLTLLRQRRHAVSLLLLVLCLIAFFKFIAAAMLLKSWALLLWLNTEAVLGICAGSLLLLAASWLTRPYLLLIAAVTSFTYLVLAHFVLDSGSASASVAMRLYQWNDGHLFNYNGLSKAISLVFPFMLLGYLWRVRRQYGEAL